MRQYDLDERWLLREGRVAIRRRQIKSSSTAAEEQGDEAASHAVPQDFDASLLGPGAVDVSSEEAACASLAQLMSERWMALHDEVCQPPGGPCLGCTNCTSKMQLPCLPTCLSSCDDHQQLCMPLYAEPLLACSLMLPWSSAGLH